MSDLFAEQDRISGLGNAVELDLDDDDLEEDLEEPDDEIIRAKWTIDGATKLSEAAAALRDFATHLESLEAQGFQLVAPVEDDYGFIRQTASQSTMDAS